MLFSTGITEVETNSANNSSDSSSSGGFTSTASPGTGVTTRSTTNSETGECGKIYFNRGKI